MHSNRRRTVQAPLAHLDQTESNNPVLPRCRYQIIPSAGLPHGFAFSRAVIVLMQRARLSGDVTEPRGSGDTALVLAIFAVIVAVVALIARHLRLRHRADK